MLSLASPVCGPRPGPRVPPDVAITSRHRVVGDSYGKVAKMAAAVSSSQQGRSCRECSQVLGDAGMVKDPS